MNETHRLNILHDLNILDTPPEQEFEDITSVTAHMFRVPIALISLIDRDRQWFKAKVGISVEGTERCVSFCTFAIESDEVLVVENACTDERFRDNPFVTGEMEVRFYAGAPLIINGARIGTLCIIDSVARSFSALDAASLKILANQVTELIKLRTRVKLENDRVLDSYSELSTLIESLPQIIWKCQVDGKTTFMSSQWQEFTGSPFPGSWENHIHPEDLNSIIAGLKQSRMNRKKFSGECRIRGKGSIYSWFKLNETPKFSGLEITGWIGTATDISDLKQKEEMQNSFFSLPGTMMCLAGVDGYFKKLNDAWQEILGYELEELYRQQWLYFVHPDDIENTIAEGEKLSRGFGSIDFENRYRHRDGTYRWLQWSSIPKDGLYYCLVRDITHLKEAQEAVKAQQSILRSIVDNSSSIIYLKDTSGKYLLVNAEFERSFGLSSEDVISKTDFDLFPPALAEKYRINDVTVAQTSSPLAIEESAIVHGEKRNYLSAKFPVIGHMGEVIAVGGISTDLTELKKVEAEKVAFRNAEQAATQASQLKSEFLANMSHEIRTPINGVIGMTGLLFDTHLTEEQREYAETIRSSADSLLTVINDILDFSKIEAGKLDFDTVDFDLQELFDDTQKILAITARNKGLDLRTNLSSKLPRRLRGDPGRIKQVLLNLTSNAVKFTETGTVTVSSDLIEESHGLAKIRCEITDTGIGISESSVRNLFTPFTQADSSTHRRYGGTGLGLSICKRIIDFWKGEIGVNSTVGKGSTFWFELTLPISEQPAVTAPKYRNLNGASRRARILVVDDNVVNQKITGKMIEKMGAYSDTAANGFEAVRAIESADYDVVLMDCQMPDCDGYEATRRIRLLNDKTKAAVQILAMTANAMRGDDEKCLRAGMNGYISKPVSFPKLEELLLPFLNGVK